MSKNDLADAMSHAPPEYTKALGLVIDSVLQEYTHEERMFWAMQYAEAEYRRADTGDNDLMDYRIAVDEVSKAARDNDRVD